MTTLMRNGRDRRSENPSGPTRYLSACYCLGPISGSHQGQRPQRPLRDGGKPSGENRPYTWLHPNASQNVRFFLHRGRRPYMAQSVISLLCSKRSLSGGGFNRSTQHPSLVIWHVGTVCISGACTNMVHAKAKGWPLGALEERPLGGGRRPSTRGTRAVSKILALNGGIAPAPRRRASTR